VQDAYAALAPIYDRLVDIADDVAFYRSLAQHHGGPLLEVGAGSGRVALPLARAGYEVVALDSSPSMVEAGRRVAAAEQLPITWLLGDVTARRLGGPYRLVLWALDGFLHLPSAEAQRKALSAIRRSLMPDGRLVLDLPSLAAWWDWQPGVRPLELTWTGEDASGTVTMHYETFQCDPSRQTRTVTHLIESVAPNGAVSKGVTSYTLRFVGRFEVALLLSAARLRVCAEYGDYDLNPPAPQSERLIVVAGI
jgi:SAM-dependent methyltransferase